MSTHGEPRASVFGVLTVLADLMSGGAHSRHTIARSAQVSLPTADRWIGELVARIPGIKTRKQGKTTWLEMRRTPHDRGDFRELGEHQAARGGGSSSSSGESSG